MNEMEKQQLIFTKFTLNSTTIRILFKADQTVV